MWKVGNTFVPKFIPDNLKWYELDGLETWYFHNKCEFLEDTDLHFKNGKIVNFDIINNVILTVPLGRIFWLIKREN